MAGRDRPDGRRRGQHPDRRATTTAGRWCRRAATTRARCVSDQPWARPGMDNPRIFWVPSISPSSIMFYTGDKFPRWKNSLFVGALTPQQLQRISFNQPSQAERREPLLLPLDMRIRDVQQSPDGYIYVATEDGRRRAADGDRAADRARAVRALKTANRCQHGPRWGSDAQQRRIRNGQWSSRAGGEGLRHHRYRPRAPVQ